MGWVAIQVRAQDLSALSMEGADFIGGPDPQARPDIQHGGFPPEHAEIIIKALSRLKLPYRVGPMNSDESTAFNEADW